MTWVSLGVAAIGAVGGAMSKPSGGGGSQQERPQTATSTTSGGSSSQSYIDPRMENILFGTGGIIPSATDWYNQNSSGTNEQMITGMNNQWNQLGASRQGFNQMQNLGMGLMGGGVAGNPFTGGGGIAPQQVQYTPATFDAGTENPFTQTAKPASVLPTASSGGGGGGGGGEGGGAVSGALAAAMNAMQNQNFNQGQFANPFANLGQYGYQNGLDIDNTFA